LPPEFHGDSAIVSPLWRRRAPAEPVDDTVAIEREEVIEEAPPPPPPRIWPWLLALLLLVLGGVLAYVLLARGDEKTTMPRVVGMTEAEARARLADAELESDVDRRLSERKAGIVVAQTPGAGTQLDEGERVEIIVSSGFERVTVPSVRDLEEREAVEKLEAAGLEAEVRRLFAGAPKGTVVEQDPRGGERVQRGTTVALAVSKGRNLATVPNLVGRTEAEALRLLRAREFEPRIFDVPSTEARGTVVSQAPPPGAKAPPDSRVRINVSTGEQSGSPTERAPTTTSPSGATVTVPNVVGLAQTPALRRLRNTGLRGVVSYRASDERRGRVIEQFPAAGTAKNRDARVRVVVSAGRGTAEELVVPDVRGEDETTATQTLEDAGFRVEVIRTGDGTTVEDQQPAPGVTSSRGAVVTLFVG
jgi:beta-lactam-binding protein with PASTA domain